MMSDTHSNYLKDLGFIIRENCSDALKDYKEAKRKGEDVEFKQGYLMGLHSVASLMQNQAAAFQISDDEIGFKEFNAEDLIN